MSSLTSGGRDIIIRHMMNIKKSESKLVNLLLMIECVTKLVDKLDACIMMLIFNAADVWMHFSCRASEQDPQKKKKNYKKN